MRDSIYTDAAVIEARGLGCWCIVRKGMQHMDAHIRAFSNEHQAKRAWARLDVRQGWAVLMSASGGVVHTTTAPWGVRTKW